MHKKNLFNAFQFVLKKLQGQSWVEQCLSEDLVTVAVSDNMTVRCVREEATVHIFPLW